MDNYLQNRVKLDRNLYCKTSEVTKQMTVLSQIRTENNENEINTAIIQEYVENKLAENARELSSHPTLRRIISNESMSSAEDSNDRSAPHTRRMASIIAER